MTGEVPTVTQISGTAGHGLKCRIGEAALSLVMGGSESVNLKGSGLE